MAQVNAAAAPARGIKYKSGTALPCSSTRAKTAAPKDTSSVRPLPEERQSGKGGTLKCRRTPESKSAGHWLRPHHHQSGRGFDYSGTQACRALKAQGALRPFCSTPTRNHHDRRTWPTMFTSAHDAGSRGAHPGHRKAVLLPSLPAARWVWDHLSMELARSGYLDRTGIRLLACKPRPSTAPRTASCSRRRWKSCTAHHPVRGRGDFAGRAGLRRPRIGYPVIVRPLHHGRHRRRHHETREKLIEIGTNGLRVFPPSIRSW